MTKIKRNAALLAASAAVLSLTAPLAATASTPAAPTAPATAKSLDWQPCKGSGVDPRQECATVEVPMDYAHPKGKQIGIAVSRIPGENPDARRGALLLIPGGPGGSGINNPSGKGQKLPQAVRDAYDLIGFDPRGMGRSTPVSCGLGQADLAPSRLRPWPAPDGSVTGNMTAARRVSDACARNGGDLIRHISTANEARDLDRVRAALGERKVSAWGVSYGTYVGAVYSQLFPHRTDRVVLDSNDDPDPTRVSRGWLAGHEQGVEDTFPEFAKWASAPGNPDRLARTAAEVRPLFLRLAAELDRDPIPWPGANPAELDGNVLRQALLTTLYDPDDFPGLAELILAARKGTVPPAPQAPPEAVLQNAVAVGSAVLCNDIEWPGSPDAYAKEVAESRSKYPLTAGMPRNAMPCAAWPFRPKEAPVRITDSGPSNILLVQNERDPATPLSGALKLRTSLGERATMVTVNSTGHDAYLDNGNECGDRTVSHFLATGERPSRDKYCG
ncbi:alpha/beta hydrolase [Streptomyces durmitorensis]|uniref:Alpha/beta hydrolase n=1 Tax=Streptomyces durmitorensis TaxID=319947 RepID=A0ABY4PLY1_9ACTN|nr:alpha/beta hydrolase [Streptomyces durmitorensis]UQT54149.1 alpha/beta hydrolase [Streptomyces durmitorensis]